MNNKIIIKLKKLINIHKLDGYIIPKNDAYFSNYPSLDRLKIVSNFSGSAGLAIILKKKNYLFVDGRYTLQAIVESGKNFNIKEIPKFLPKQIIKKNQKKITLGYDPQLFTISNLKKKFDFNFDLKAIKKNLVDEVYNDNKIKSLKPFYILDEKVSGEKTSSKINRLIKIMKSKNISNIFISAPENVAWLLNIRGGDNPYSPIPNY